MENKFILIILSCTLPLGCTAEVPDKPVPIKQVVNKLAVKKEVVKTPKDYWKEFPDDGVEKIIVIIHTTKVIGIPSPNLFLKNNHPAIKKFTIDDPDEVTRLTYEITGVSGEAGAKLFKHHRTFAKKMGTISFYRKGKKFDVTISNVGFFMGTELNNYHLFYSWRLAKLVNDISKKYGPGLCQGGFNSLAGAGPIVSDQIDEICNNNKNNERSRICHKQFQLYKQRPANIWNMFPKIDEWPKGTAP